MLGCGLLLLGGAAALAGANHESAVKEMIAVFGEMATAIDQAKTVKEARPKLEKLAVRAAKAKKQLEDNKPSAEEEAKLKETYAPQMKDAASKLSAALQGMSQRDPLGLQDLKDIFDPLQSKGPPPKK